MHCQLLIPGLLWPDEALRAALKDDALPALSVLLGRGRHAWKEPSGMEDWLAARLARGGDEPPFAALRLLGEDDAPPADGAWLCADPVHLQLTQQGFILADAGMLDLGREEAEAIVASLNQEFSDLGRFHAAAADRWYLRLAAPARLAVPRLADVVGRRVEHFLPEGADARKWRQHFNEIQVFLHQHAVNQRREAAGRPAVNSVWFWGPGALPGRGATPAFGAVATDDALARGMARHAGIGVLPAGDGLALSGAGNRDFLAIADYLQRPALTGDAYAWREALLALEANWLAPALQALQAGRLQGLGITALGDHSSLELEVTRGDLRKFWRRRRHLSALKVPDLAGHNKSL